MRLASFAFAFFALGAVFGTGATAYAQGGVESLVSRAQEAATMPIGAPAAEPPVLSGLEHFFAREPLGFDNETLARQGKRLGEVWAQTRASTSSWWAEPLGVRAVDAGIVLAVLLVLFVLWRVDRRLQGAIDEKTGRLTIPRHVYLTHVAVAFSRAIGRTSFPVVALLLTYLPLRSLAGDAPYAPATSRIALLWLTYRGVAGLARQLINSRVVEITDLHARQCRRIVIWALRFFVAFGVAEAVAVALGAGGELRSLLDFGLRLALTGVTIRVIFIKGGVMDLLPDVGPGIYLRARGFIDRFYYPLTSGTSFLLLLWSFGWERASLSILWRLYAALALLVVGSLVLRRMLTWLERDRASEDPDNPRRLAGQVIDDAGGLLRFFLLLILASGMLLALGLYDTVISVLRYPLFAMGSVAFSLYTFVAAVLVLMVFLLLSRLFRTVLEVRVYPRFDLDEGLAYAASKTLQYFMLVMGVVGALLSTGLDLTALGVFFGALGIGIGLGLQELVRDLVAGFVLLFGRAIKKGDFVNAGPSGTGEVQRVGVRSVTVRTRDHHELLIPTSTVVNGTIINYSHTSPMIRTHVAVGASYAADPKVVCDVLLAAAHDFPDVAKVPEPSVWLTGFGDSSVNYELLVWMNAKKQSESAMRGQLYFIIWDKLHEAGIEIPFPQRDLHIKSIEADLSVIRRGEEAA